MKLNKIICMMIFLERCDDMKKILNILIVIVASFILFISKAYAKEVNVYVFYGKTCPHCHEAMEYLDSIKDNYDLNIVEYEVWYDNDNKNKMDMVADYLDFNVKGVPFVVIDNTPIVGFAKGDTDNTYLYHIKKASSNSFIDLVGIKLGVVDSKNKISNDINLFGKKIEVSKSSAFILSLLLGLGDKTHIYMILVIIMLSSLLVNINNRKLGFITGLGLCMLTSALYLISVLLNIDYTNYLGLLNIIRILTSIVLIIIGIILLIIIIKRIDSDKQTQNKIEKFIKRNKSILIIIFSIVVSLLLLICMFSNYNDTFLLLASNVSKISYFIIYMLVNIVIYLLVYKLWKILKMHDKNRKYLIVINACILIIFGILLGLTKIIYI